MLNVHSREATFMMLSYFVLVFFLIGLAEWAHFRERAAGTNENTVPFDRRSMPGIARFFPTWSGLRGLGNNRLLRTTIFWMVAIPIVAKVLRNVNELATFTLFGQAFEVSLSLPFSWSVFFYGSLLATVANVFYLLRCPKLIQHFQTYADFRESGSSVGQLLREFTNALATHYRSLSVRELKKNVEEFSNQHCVTPNSAHEADRRQRELAEIDSNPWAAVRLAGRLEIDPSKTADAFWFIREFVEGVSPRVRILCAICYVAAMGCFLWVFLQNILFVIRWQLGCL